MKAKIIKLLPTNFYLYLRWYDFKLSQKDSFKKIQQLRLADTEASGGYLPFDKAKAIFVHIPKCAGISVNKALFNSIGGGHTTLDQYINIFPPALFQSYFKFTFVRNPWDRVVSAYTFLQKGGLNKWDNEFYEREIKQYDSFKAFVQGWLKPENLFKHHHFRPQYRYFVDKYNKVSVDFIGYFEHIEEDFNYIANRMNLEVKLSKSNAVARSDYGSFYDEETKHIVAKIYKKDIQFLNYEFDRVSTPVRKLDMTKHIFD